MRPRPPAILDWWSVADQEQAPGAHAALLQCLAKVYAWSQTTAADATPQGWAQALNHLPDVSPGALQTATYTGTSVDGARQALVDAVLAAAGTTHGSASAVSSAIGSPPVPGTTQVIQVILTPSRQPGLRQLVSTASTDEPPPDQHRPAWRLELTTRGFLLDWFTLSSDPAARAQWDRFMEGVHPSTITALPSYQQIR